MDKNYKAPVAEVVLLHLNEVFCLSGDRTEDVGFMPYELTDDDFE